MGAWIQSLAIRTPNRDSVKQSISNWMSTKGYVLCDQPKWFECDEHRERGFYLVSNRFWTIVLFNQKFEEYERLTKELRHCIDAVMLFLFCFDSDEWGFHLLRNREVLDEFQTRTHFFPSASDAKQHATVLCEHLEINDQISAIEKILRRRAIFSEEVLKRFCDALDIVPASVGYEDLSQINAAIMTASNVGGFHIEQLRFVMRNATETLFPLHSFTKKVERHEHGFDIPIPSETEDWIRHFQVGFKLLQLALTPLVLFLRVAGRVVEIGIWLSNKLHRRRNNESTNWGTGPLNLFLRDLSELNPNRQRVEQGYLVNDYFGCRLQLPDSAEPIQPYDSLAIFQLRWNQLQFTCQAIRLQQVRVYFQQSEYSTIEVDDKFLIGTFPARLLVYLRGNEQRTSRNCICLIESPKCYFIISVMNSLESSEIAVKALLQLASTFELTSSTQNHATSREVGRPF